MKSAESTQIYQFAILLRPFNSLALIFSNKIQRDILLLKLFKASNNFKLHRIFRNMNRFSVDFCCFTQITGMWNCLVIAATSINFYSIKHIDTISSTSYRRYHYHQRHIEFPKRIFIIQRAVTSATIYKITKLIHRPGSFLIVAGDT